MHDGASTTNNKTNNKTNNDEMAVRGWLEQFAEAVCARDYEAGKRMFADNVIGFGTYTDSMIGLETLVERQWKNIWDVTRGFRFDADSIRCGVCGDLAWAAVTWRSQGQGTDGVWYERPGRATFILEQREGRWRAIHSHLSLNPMQKTLPVSAESASAEAA